VLDVYRGSFDDGIRALTAAADAFDAIGVTMTAASYRLLAGRTAHLLGDRRASVLFHTVATGPTGHRSSARVLEAIADNDLAVARATADALGGADRAAAELAIAHATGDANGVLAASARLQKLSSTMLYAFAVADALFKTGRIDEAEVAYLRVTRLPHVQPLESGRAWHRVGLLREQRGDITGARAAFEQVVNRWGANKLEIEDVVDARRRLREPSTRSVGNGR
jgi:hypothetical protein